MSAVLSLDSLGHAVRTWRREGAVIVLAAGCFDPLHLGHVQHLEAARTFGNVLIVGVASDQLLSEKRRPFMPDYMRAGIVAGLRCVDAAIVNEAACQLIEVVRPHVYVKGSEYRGNLTPALAAEAELLARQGGRLEFVSGSDIYSSTKLLAGAA